MRGVRVRVDQRFAAVGCQEAEEEEQDAQAAKGQTTRNEQNDTAIIRIK